VGGCDRRDVVGGERKVNDVLPSEAAERGRHIEGSAAWPLFDRIRSTGLLNGLSGEQAC
jgi:hypothetical protein